MRKFFLLAPAMLAACATATMAASYPPVHGVTPGHSCTTARTQRFIGRTRSQAVRTAIMRASNAALLRWAPPGVMLTMDYRSDRVTVHLNSANRITSIKCG
ncbi:MAG: hypothetical protein HOP95_05965 [Sphingomonas sp.]|nr:hypothetical protein [Sphingomonas sp.]